MLAALTTNGAGSTVIHLPGEEVLRYAAFGLGMLADGIAVAIIAAAVVKAAWSGARAAFHPGRAHPPADIRLSLGRSLALALEFLLAADIVRTAVAPTWEDIGKLAAIAVIRTGLNYFLQRDIEHEQSQQPSHG